MMMLPIAKRKDGRDDGERSTGRAILEICDATADAIRTGIPYQVRLDLPPTACPSGVDSTGLDTRDGGRGE